MINRFSAVVACAPIRLYRFYNGKSRWSTVYDFEERHLYTASCIELSRWKGKKALKADLIPQLSTISVQPRYSCAHVALLKFLVSYQRYNAALRVGEKMENKSFSFRSLACHPFLET